MNSRMRHQESIQVCLTEEEKFRVISTDASGTGLPNRCYTCEDFFSSELTRFFHPRWMAVAVGSQIPNKGDVLPIMAAGVPLILVRDAEMNIAGFHNVCSHRGLKLVDKSCNGKRLLVCPYHAWSYGLNGKLVSTPDVGGRGENKLDGFERAHHNLKPVRTAQWLDVIFVNLSGTAEPLEQFFGPLNRRWHEYDFSNACHGGPEDGVIVQELQANWKLAAENFLDTYHLPVVHGRSLQAYSPIEQRYFFHEPNRYIGIGSAVYTPDRGQPLPQFPNLSESQSRVAEYCYLFPNLSLGLARDHLMVMINEPISCDLTKVTVHIYYTSEKSLDDSYQASRRATTRDFRQVLAEDFDIINGLQKGRESPAFDGGYLSPVSDVTILQLHDFLARQL